MPDITDEVLQWMLSAETEEDKEFYWSLYNEACERKRSA
jgi:hypothetical protein